MHVSLQSRKGMTNHQTLGALLVRAPQTPVPGGAAGGGGAGQSPLRGPGLCRQEAGQSGSYFPSLPVFYYIYPVTGTHTSTELLGAAA